ncbi:MAG TPA: hypothetical protein VE173_04235 [Longimicrobiales bacterium]|nr:hypothetical protein [Longimicrobiales bacterium]
MKDAKALTPVTERQLETARTKGQVIGFAQGAVAMLLVGIVLKFLGWIPFIAVGGAVFYIGYKLLSRRKDGERE